MGNPIPLPAANKIQKLIPRLGTDADGEIIATVRAIGRALKAQKCDWHDLAAALTETRSAPSSSSRRAAQPERGPPTPPSPDHEAFLGMAIWLYENAMENLRGNSRSFVVSMVRRLSAGYGISPKQEQYLKDLFYENSIRSE